MFEPTKTGFTRRRLSFDTAILTDTGRVRRNNEDRVLAIEHTGTNIWGAESAGIYLIADGLGGHQAGEVASEMASQIISHNLLEGLKSGHKVHSPVSMVKSVIEKANEEIVSLAGRDKALRFMGTTATVGLRLDDILYIGHVGDSRAYLIRGTQIKQITEDHSVVAQLVKEGIITPAEAAEHAEKGVLFRCLGSSDIIVVETITQRLRDGDSLVFCSDGLTAHIRDVEILNLVNSNRNSDEACRSLIQVANCRGGEDNSSIIVVNIKLK